MADQRSSSATRDLARPAAHAEPLVPGTARGRLSPAAALGYGPVARACLQLARCSVVIVSPGGPRSGTQPAGQETRIRPCHLAARVATRHTPRGCRARTPAMTRHGRRAWRKRRCPAPGGDVRDSPHRRGETSSGTIQPPSAPGPRPRSSQKQAASCSLRSSVPAKARLPPPAGSPDDDAAASTRQFLQHSSPRAPEMMRP